MTRRTITTSIFYPNGNPHLGHALEWVQADFLARYYKLQGDEVFFQIGLDEHGLKVQRAAEARGLDTQTYIDGQQEIFQALAAKLHISADVFVRTSSDKHKAMAQAVWQACANAGYIEKRTYAAWYNVKQEEHLGLVAEHPDPAVFGVDLAQVEKIEEENYFFKLSEFTPKVLEVLTNYSYAVTPEFRLQELVKFLQEKGLQDISISREKSKLSWGVPVPGDDSQVMYVWFDALVNYLTHTCEIVDGKIVPGPQWADAIILHCVGKDIARFHAHIWPAMLLAAGLPLPKELLVHGFITREGKVMSKSLGNGVEPTDVIDMYGADALRWYLLSALPTTDDGEYTPERMQAIYTTDLVNNLGNLVSRVVNMWRKYAGDTAVLVPDESPMKSKVVFCHQQILSAIREDLWMQEVCNQILLLLDAANHSIEEIKPWVLAKDPSKHDELLSYLSGLLEVILHILNHLQPILPELSARLPQILGEDGARRVYNNDRFFTVEQWGIATGWQVPAESDLQLFPRITLPE